MLRALIFDFDGVVVDSEPFHMAGFLAVMQEQYGVSFTEREYYEQYLAYSDADGFRRMLADRGIGFDEPTIARLVGLKSERLQRMLACDTRALPGAVELMRSAREAGVGVGICSGALRCEIELAARSAGALEFVQTIVSADDVPVGKPDPTGYRLARRKLAEALGGELSAEQCVVIEDAPAGIAAGKAAGMKVLAVANSAPPAKLAAADRIVASLAEVTLEDLGALAG